MKTHTLVLVTAMALNAPAALLVYDGFDYASGSNLGGQGGWENVNSGDEVTVAANGLAVLGLAPAVGNAVTFGGGGTDPQRTFASASSSLYYSLALQVNNLGSLNTSGGYMFGFSSGGTTFGATLWLRSDGAGGFNIGLSQRSSAATWDTTSFGLNTTIFIVAQYIVNSGSGNDTAALWINPDSSAFSAATAPAATISVANSGSDLSGIDRVFIRQDSTTATPAVMTLDELRIGTTWADVTPVPEPTNVALALFGSAALMCGAAARLHARRARRCALEVPTSDL